MEKILIVEDNVAMLEMLASIIADKGYEVRTAGDAAAALHILKTESVALVLSDLQLPQMDGLSLFKKIKPLRIPFIILTAFGSIETAVEAIKGGAFDFIAKPVDPDYLMLMIEKALESTRILRENILLKEVLTDAQQRTVIIGQSREIQLAAEKVKQVAVTDSTALLTGESGTGKELFARAIHNLSPRRDKPFIAINSASIPENLLENELFGHEKGSFTGAHLRHIGKLELAQNGSFFFDEIGDFPFHLQGKILRVLEEKKINRIGSSQQIDLDIRFIFATNQDLEKAIAENRFRKDLYFRITTFPIVLPPLRQRQEDIDLLADYFCRKYALEMKKGPLEFSDQARSKLRDYQWPGNVRELQNTIERAVILTQGRSLNAAEVIIPEKPFSIPDAIGLEGNLKAVLADAKRIIERMKIEKALQETNGKRNQAARQLGISYKSLLEKIKNYGLDGEF